MPGGLYIPQLGGTRSFWTMGQEHAGRAINAYGSLQKKQETEINPPGKTAGAGIMAGAGGAAAGYSLGAAIGGGAASGSAAGPYGAIIGAAAGVVAYLLS